MTKTYDMAGGTFFVYHAGTSTFMDIDDGVYLIQVPEKDTHLVDEGYLQSLLLADAGHRLANIVSWRKVFGNE